MSESSKQFTLAEMKEMNDKVKTVLVIHDKVYDVTSFLNEHPGGEEILLDHAGKDATEDFSDVGHSKDALELMKKYQIGEVVEAERRNLPTKQGWQAGYNSKTPEKEKYVAGPGVPFYVFAGAIAFGILAIYYLSL